MRSIQPQTPPFGNTMKAARPAANLDAALSWRLALSRGVLGCALGLACCLSSNAWAATGRPEMNNSKKEAPKTSACAVRQFRTMALSTHDPKARETASLAWLKAYGPDCSLAQIRYLSDNSAQWLGTADSVRVSGLFDELIDAKSGGFAAEKAPPTPPTPDAETSAKGRPQGPNGPTTVVPPPAAPPSSAVVVAAPTAADPVAAPVANSATPSGTQATGPSGR